MPSGVMTSHAMSAPASSASGRGEVAHLAAGPAGPAELDGHVGRGAVAEGQHPVGPGPAEGEAAAGGGVSVATEPTGR